MSGSTIENESVTDGKTISSEKTNNDETNATIEERYNKVRIMNLTCSK